VRIRAFLALWPEPDWCEQLLAALAPLRPRVSARWLPAADLHVTLRFLGAVEAGQLDALRAAAAEIAWQPFALRFERLEWWREAQVLAAIAPQVPAAAAELVQALTRAATAAGMTFDLKPFRPHVTLARRVRAAALSALSWTTLELSAQRFCLVRSDTRAEGARYTVLHSWAAAPDS
jgi:2'-5' RNA ligase